MFFHKNTQNQQSSTSTQADAISGESSVADWLAHPVGGVIFRDMLAQAGQNENVLRPVRRLSLNRLIKLSKGKFTQEMLDDMVQKANSGHTPPVVETAHDAPVLEKVGQELPEWQEKITEGRFADKTIIVTGAGSGIGRATASRIAREGGRVVAVDISSERLDEFKNELPEAQIELIVGDITEDGVITKIVQVAGETIDGLANVAGIMDNMTPLHEVSDEIWNRVMNVNVLGMMKLSRAVVPHMLAANKGTIVNVGSEASLKASVAGAAYVTSKHAVAGLSKSMAFMYGPSGIRTNMVAPGAVLTNIDARFDSQLGEERVNSILATMPDAAESAELAAAITFLLSDDSVNINGALLPSDGGWSVQ